MYSLLYLLIPYTCIIRQLREIEASHTAENYSVNLEEASSCIVESGLGLEQTFFTEEDPVSDLEKAPVKVFLNTKHT